MAADLGTWPPEQATVLLEVLNKAGLSPEARRGRDGVKVTVPDDESDKAHQTIVANMDTIARAARQQPGPKPRRSRPTPTPRAGDGGREGATLGSERLRRFARPLGVLIIGMLLAMLIPPLRLPLTLFTVAAVVYLLGRQTQRDDDGD